MQTTSPPTVPAPRPRWFRPLAWLALLVAVVALVWALFDWNWFKHPIEQQVSALTGRPFHIEGNLGVRLSRTPLITADRIVLGNLPGAKDPEMLRIERLAFRLSLRDLLRWKLVLPEVTLAEPELLLEKTAEGKANWIFPNLDPDAKWPLIRRLTVQDGTLAYRDPTERTDLIVSVNSGQSSATERMAPILIDGKGVYANNPFTVDGKLESPLALEHSERPYHIDLRAQAGQTRATADGVLIGPVQRQGFDVNFGLSGPDMALLYPLIAVATPNTPPYRLKGQLTRTGKTWHYDHFAGIVGDSDLAGNASVDTAGKRPYLRADLVSKRLDFDDLSGFVGAPPQTGSGETASPAQKRDAAELHASARVLPDEQYHLDKLRNMDADVKLRAQHIKAPSLPLEAMTAHLFLDDGVLRLDPLNFQVAGGEVDSRIRMDARNSVIASTANIHARGLKLPELFPKAKLTETSVGRVGGHLDLTASGNSVARMLATSDGQIGVNMGSGRISNLLLEYAGIDIAESLKFLIKGDRTIPVRCAFGDFKVNKGLMTAQRMAFDTTDTVIKGEGTINLRDERLDMRLKPLPKDHSLVSLRSPLLVTGTFKDPEFRPDMKRLTLRGVAAAALAMIAPPAALIPLFETGPGKNVDCGVAVAVK
jgi:uncharacterized protein involved in outer membrane biogenesis